MRKMLNLSLLYFILAMFFTVNLPKLMAMREGRRWHLRMFILWYWEWLCSLY